MATSIIIHPLAAKPVPFNPCRCLETHGPIPGDFGVHRIPGHFLPVANFDEFSANREHYCNIHPQRSPRLMDPEEVEALAAKRIVRIVDAVERRGEITWDQLKEIRWRALIAQPHCMLV